MGLTITKFGAPTVFNWRLQRFIGNLATSLQVATYDRDLLRMGSLQALFLSRRNTASCYVLYQF